MLGRFIHKTLGVPYKLAVPIDVRRKTEDATVLFLHGIAATSSTWRELVGELKKDPAFDAVRLTSVDLLGFGKSPAPGWLGYTVNDYLRALRRTTRSLKITGPIYIVGHSMGSLLATDYAARYGDASALLLISPPFMRPEEQRVPADKLYAMALDNLKKAAQTNSGKKAGKVVEKFTSFEVKYTSTPAFRRSMDQVVLKGHAWQEAKKLEVPVVLVHGRFDSVVSRSNLVKLAKLPHISLAESANGHSISQRRRPFVVKQLKKLIAH
ncbi:MAG: alpha/beta hydrolase [Candidatus Nomurabacteria bacterium]|jgi:pimeloyl-ACP methyl ester carboxylesterase|nr:alpha/beta hydrolase [Candidatus Nomurabacteria bacterium]